MNQFEEPVQQKDYEDVTEILKFFADVIEKGKDKTRLVLTDSAFLIEAACEIEDLRSEYIDLSNRIYWLIDNYNLWSEDRTFTFPDGDRWASAHRGIEESKQ